MASRLQVRYAAQGEYKYALNCPCGGIHNEMRDLNCNLLELAGLKQVTREPIVRNSDMNGENGLRADWGARGFRDAKQMVLLVFVFSTQNPRPW